MNGASATGKGTQASANGVVNHLVLLLQLPHIGGEYTPSPMKWKRSGAPSTAIQPIPTDWAY